MITLTVNGKAQRVDVDPETPLLYVLRGELALNGAKFGCGLGQCGACTVMVDGVAVNSCITPVGSLEGRRVVTVEGLGTAGKPGVLQQAFISISPVRLSSARVKRRKDPPLRRLPMPSPMQPVLVFGTYR